MMRTIIDRTNLVRVGLLTLITCLSVTAGADEWPQWRGPNRDGVWSEGGLVESFATEQLPHRWTANIGSGYSGPTVADGRVYVMDRLVEPKQLERVHCFDWKTGETVWTHTYDCPYVGISYQAGPRASVTIHDGLAYSLGTMGHLICFDAATGEVKWQRNMQTDYNIQMPIWGIAASPIVVDDQVIVQIGGEPDACLVALNRKSGEEAWTALADRASYSSPILIEQAGKRVLVAWTGGHVAGLNPTTGEVYWKHPFPPQKMVIGIATPVVEDNRLFVTSFYDGSLMLRLKTDSLDVEEIWQAVGPNERNTEALQSIISTPYLEGDYVYGVDSYGELRCLEAETGKRVWESLEATPKARWSTIHMVENGKNIWMFNERGDLIIARLSPKGYQEISRAKLLEPTEEQLRQRGGVCWSHPAYAYGHVFARNDNEIVCANLQAE